MRLLYVVAVGVAAGIAMRRWAPPRFSTIFRAQQLTVLLPLAVLSGWAFHWHARQVVVLAAVLTAELLAALTAIGWARRRGAEPILAVAAGSNTTFWSVPVAASLVPPAQVVLLAVYDTLVAVRGAVQTRFLRRRSPVRHSRRSATADFAKPLGLSLGLALALTDPAPQWAPSAVAILGELSGVLGIAILVLALPSRWPDHHSLRRAAPAVVLRYGFVTLALAALTLTGTAVPAVTWVVATAPAPFSTVAYSRLYGFSTSVATACVLLTVTISTAGLPALFLLTR